MQQSKNISERELTIGLDLGDRASLVLRIGGARRSCVEAAHDLKDFLYFGLTRHGFKRKMAAVLLKKELRIVAVTI
jgi:hypothetical protein